MSIITKALKKAQEDRSKKQSYGKEVVENKTVEGPSFDLYEAPKLVRGKKRTLRTVIVIATGIVLVVCAIISGALWMRSGGRAEVKRDPSKVISVPERISGPAKEIEQKEKDGRERKDDKVLSKELRPSKLPALNGIMYSPVSPKAIINDVMVSTGEIVDGFMILGVFPDKVDMRSPEGIEFELKLR